MTSLIRNIGWSDRLKTIINPIKYPLSKLIILIYACLSCFWGIVSFSRWLDDGVSQSLSFALGCFAGVLFCMVLLLYVAEWSRFWSQFWAELTAPEPPNARWRRTNMFWSCASIGIVGSIAFASIVLSAYAMYVFTTGGDLMLQNRMGAAFVLCIGAMGASYAEFMRQYKQLERSGTHDMRALSYVEAALGSGFGVFAFISFIGALAALTKPITSERASLFVFEWGLAIALLISLLSLCSHARRRREFRFLAIGGTVLAGALVGALYFTGFLYMWVLFDQTVEARFFPWMNTILIVGAAIGGTFNYWRCFIRTRGEGMTVTIGKTLDLTSSILSRGKLVALSLRWVILGSFIVMIDLWLVMDILPRDQFTPLLVVVALSLPALYWILARGITPAWHAVIGPKRLTKDDLVHGHADVADEDEAGRAARGESGPR
jgi:hypothetical protein